MYTSTRGFGKGVSLWIPITVFLSVMALIFTLLPSTSAQAQETTMEELTISETTDSIVDSTQSLPVDGGDAPPGVVEEGPVIVDDIPAPDVVNEEGNSVIDDLLGLITPQQAQAPTNWGNLAQDIVIVGEGSNPGDPIRVGENVDISGRWDGRGLDIQEGDSFEIQFPEVVTLIPLEFDLVFGTTDDWGTCAPDMAGNRYVCTIDVLPGVQTYGTWEASARATQESTEYNIIGSDYSLGKEGGILYLGGNLLDQPAGTVTRWMATIDAQNPVTLPDPIVLTDTFSPNLEICANPAVTDLEVRHGGVTYRDIATYTQTGPNTMTITINPPTGGFEIGLVPADPIEVLYQLCTASGGLDPVGTEYTNTVEWGTLGADAQVTQTRSTSGTIVALNRGTFDLNKVVNAPVPPATIPVPGTITVQVEEFEPGEYPDGTPEATYTVLVNTDGTIVNGQNSRPDGWTIRLTELPPAEIPGYTWGTPEFSGDGVVTGTDAEGRPYAVITTTQSGNVALQLDNYLSPNTPEIGTVARVEGSADNILPLTGGTVVDTVRYENLEPNTEYRLDGEIVAVDEDGTVTETGITSSDTFTTGDAPAGQSLVSGTTTVTFTLTAAQAERWAGQRLVVYERLFEPSGPTPDVPVTVHEDPEDEEQTFFVDEGEPLIGTLAQVQGDNPKLLPLTGGEVVDTVSYRFLTPETEYRLDGELMHVDEDGTVTATGIIADITFTTPAAEPGENYVSGTIDVTFTITAEQAYRYGGESLVVYERLFEPSGPTPDVPVTVHEDPEDEDQTFRVEDREPEIGTLAQVQGDNPKLLPLTGGTVVDTVSYTDLLPNTEYRLDGELMHVATNGTVTPTGITSDATFTTPAAADGENYVSGTVDVTFTISAADAVEYAGESLVVYERLFQPSGPTPDVPVTVHEDPEDEDQTFHVEPGGTIVVGKTVTGPKGDDVENDDDAVFQIRAEWIDSQGDEQSRTFNVTPGQPVALDGLPLDTEITLTEIGADTSVSNVKWGDIIWSGTGVVDEPGSSPNGTVTLTEPGAEIEVGLENKTSSNGLIIIPLPLFPGGEPPVPPAAPVTPTPPPQAAPAVPEVSPKDGIQPSPKDGIQPQRGAAPQAQQKTGLAATGADVVWLAGGGIMILLLGAWLVLRGRRNES